jgi:hypothetical protein
VPALALGEDLHELEDGLPGLGSGRPGVTVDELDLQRRGERLRDRVVPDLARPRPALPDPVLDSSRVNCFEVYWLPRSEWKIRPRFGGAG